MTSLISNFSLIKGDSSDIWYFNTPETDDLSENWTSQFSISAAVGGVAISTGSLTLNDGTEGYSANSRFVFQITPAISDLLDENVSYFVAIQITNSTLNYNREVAQFRLNVKPQWIS